MKQLKIKRGLSSNRLGIVPSEAEFIYTTDTKKLYIGDGTTSGGNLVGESSGGSDFPLPTTDLTYSGTTTTMTVDENSVGFGCLLHIDVDGNLIQADSNGTNIMPCHFLAVETGTGSKKILMNGFVKNNNWSWTPGEPLYVSTTTGVMTQTAPNQSGDIVQIVGFAVLATVIFFKPDYTYLTI